MDAVRLYVEGLASYRRLSSIFEQMVGRPLSRNTLNEWVLEFGERAKTPLEVSRELRPQWGRFLGVDGKALFVYPHHEHTRALPERATRFEQATLTLARRVRNTPHLSAWPPKSVFAGQVLN